MKGEKYELKRKSQFLNYFETSGRVIGIIKLMGM